MHKTLPETEHVADDTRISVVETVITHSPPGAVVKNLQTSFVNTLTSCQSHYKTTHCAALVSSLNIPPHLDHFATRPRDDTLMSC